MNVILYTTNCPRCRVLELKLKDKNIAYTTVEDPNIMIEKGFVSSPILEVDNCIYTFTQAQEWVGGQ